MCRKMTLDYLLIPHTRINSKWIKDLNISLKTIKIVEENIGSRISDISQQYFILYISPGMVNKIKKWTNGLHQTNKFFAQQRKPPTKIKRQPTEWENIFTNTSDKQLISKIHKVLTKLYTKKQTIQLENGQRTWIDTSPKRTYIWKDAQCH